MAISGVLILNFIPHSVPFEGLLTVTSMSFTSNAAVGDPQPFLDLPISDLMLSSEGDSNGSSSLPVMLGGTITSTDHPSLEGKDSIGMDLAGPHVLKIQAGDDRPLNLRLRLPRGTRVEVHRSDQEQGLLAFSLVPGEIQSSDPPDLDLTPGSGPLKVELSSADVLRDPELQAEGPVTLELQTSEFTIPVSSATKLRLTVNKPLKGPLFHPALAVNDVAFKESIQESFVDVPVIRSTLEGGALRMAHQKDFVLSADQFLQLSPPGIEEFSVVEWRDHEKKNAGMFSIGVVGQSASMAAGLSARHPVATVRASILSRWLNPTQLAAMNGFLGGIASGLVMSFLNKD